MHKKVRSGEPEEMRCCAGVVGLAEKGVRR